MGQLDLYENLYTLFNNTSRIEIKEPVEIPPVILPNNSKLITLADNCPETKSVVLVHNLSHYRRRPTNIVLVPDLFVEIDKLIFDREGLMQCTLIL